MMYMIIIMVQGSLPWKMPGEFYDQDDIIAIKQTAPPDLICFEKAKVFEPILQILYNYDWATDPEYGKIIFMFEKIVLDMNIVPTNNNLDWLPGIGSTIMR